MKYVRKYLVATHERTNPGNMQISLFSIMQRADKGFSREIFLRKYFWSRWFIYIYNDNINESCLNNGKLALNNKDCNLFSKNILTSLNVIWNALIDTKDSDKTQLNLWKSYNVDQVLNYLRRNNLFNINFPFLNINSVKSLIRNKFTDFLEKINGNVDVASIAETKLETFLLLFSSFLKDIICHIVYM